jgi:hypothetical protein
MHLGLIGLLRYALLPLPVLDINQGGYLFCYSFRAAGEYC